MTTAAQTQPAYIGVKEVAAEMGWTDRKTLEQLSAWGVRGHCMRSIEDARFTRDELERCREAALKPRVRKGYERPVAPAAPAAKADDSMARAHAALNRIKGTKKKP